MSVQVDEETPLLSSPKKSRTPLPWSQFSLVLLVKLAEPLALEVFHPFAPQLIRDIGITHGDESKVGYYVGLMQSLSFATQAITVLYWSSISDRVGRKPVILIGMFGVSLSMYWFGLSNTLWNLIASRCLSGALNGNTSVLNSVVADITDETNIAQLSAFAYTPIAWATGGTLGPLIGGSLSRPAEQFPGLFGNNDFLKEYPYFLPCAVPATFSALAWLMTLLFFKETVRSPVPVSRLFISETGKATLALQNVVGSQEPLAAVVTESADNTKPLPLRSLLTRHVIIAVGNYASLSLVSVAFSATQPLFLSTPIGFGGLGLPPSTIGKILSIRGILHGVFQVFFFARIHDYWGSKKVFQAGIASSSLAFGAFPLMNHMAKTEGLSLAVWIIVVLQTVISIGLSVSFGAIFIIIAAASPNRASVGATNGLSHVTVAIIRAIGPAAATSLFSLSLGKNYLGAYLVYYVLVALTCVAMTVASLLPRKFQG